MKKLTLFMGRTILAIVAGLATAMILISLSQRVTHALAPLPAGLDFNDRPALTEAMLNAPTAMYLLIMAGYAVASFAGGMVAAAVSRNYALRNAIIVAALLTAAGVANLLMLPHVAWFWAHLLVYIPMAWLGAKAVLGMRGRKVKGKGI